MTQESTQEVSTTTATPAVETKPSKKSLAVVIFKAALEERAGGLFPTNREFRAAVLGRIQAELSVTKASAATMYNSAKKEAEAAGTVTLGRDPKKIKVRTGSGKRGRPAGSKNRPKTETVTVEATPSVEATPVVETTAEAVA